VRLCIAAPIAVADLAPRLHEPPPPRPAGYTGAPLTALLIGELVERGHEVVALTVDYDMEAASGPAVYEGPRLQLQVLPGRRRAWRFNGLRPGRSWDDFRFERKALAQAMRASGADLVHAHWTYEFALAALDGPWPHVVTAHDSPRQIWRYTHSPYRLLRWGMARRVLAHAKVVTAVSEYMADEIRGMAMAPIRVIANPVDPLALLWGRAREVPERPRLVMVSNGWGARKNPRTALLAFAEVRRRLPAIELDVFGNDFGPGQVAHRWAMANGLDDGVRFHGAVPHRRLIEGMSRADLLLHPALEESFGVVLLEAMALGLPVVAGHSSGAVPWVAGPHQTLVDVRCADAIAQGVLQVLEDPMIYRRSSARGRQRVESEFTITRVVDAYVSLYEATIAGWEIPRP